MPSHQHCAIPLTRRAQKNTRTQTLTVAGLEVIALRLPFVSHRHLILRSAFARLRQSDIGILQATDHLLWTPHRSGTAIAHMSRGVAGTFAIFAAQVLSPPFCGEGPIGGLESNGLGGGTRN